MSSLLNFDEGGLSGLRQIRLGVGRWNFNFPSGASPSPFFSYQPTVALPRQNRKKSGAKKIFVLDTNVLLHDPQSLQKFEENTLAIPVEVLEELDRKKSAPG
ncbi:MAG: PIN domain-containing protein, partial [Coraliomargarita sp.]